MNNNQRDPYQREPNTGDRQEFEITIRNNFRKTKEYRCMRWEETNQIELLDIQKTMTEFKKHILMDASESTWILP